MEHSFEQYEVHKFGGKTLNQPSDFKKIKNYLATRQQAIIIISAIGQTTADLKLTLEMASKGQSYHSVIENIVHTHVGLANELLDDKEEFLVLFNLGIDKLNQLLKTVTTNQSYSQGKYDFVVSLGEYWCTSFFAQYSNEPLVEIDAAKFLVVNKQNGTVDIDWTQTQAEFSKLIPQNCKTNIVIPGFVAQLSDGTPTTLGFEGSDLSATVIGKLVSAKAVYIWTDVEGVFTADPNIVREANIISSLSYQEAMDLACLGASVLHPQAVQPAQQKQLPLYVGSLDAPETKTTISAYSAQLDRAVQGVAAIEKVALARITFNSPALNLAVLGSIFSWLASIDCAIYLLTQTKNEQAISFVIDEVFLDTALNVLKSKFNDMQNINSPLISSQANAALLSVVGENMSGKPGISAKLFSCLAKANINVRAIVQSINERSISVIVDRNMLNKAMNIVHGGFYLSKRKIQVGLIGPGNVGKVFLKQLLTNKAQIESSMNVSLEVIAIANSRKMLLTKSLDDSETYLASLDNSGQDVNLKAFSQFMVEGGNAHAVIVDCTAGEETTELYEYFIQQGNHIITPNKQAMSGAFSRYQNIKTLCREYNRHFLYETNVCAGLPVIKTLTDLINTGDEISQIQGVFSGTLSYIFNEVSCGKWFSSVVLEAFNKGLTEPDPRDDLNGMDVARKCVCLAREMGVEVSLEEVSITPILPDELMQGPMEAFFAKRNEMDTHLKDLLNEVKYDNTKLIYVGTISENGKIELAIKQIDKSSPFFQLSGTDNMVIFKTRRYLSNPLVIQGPGAGAEVTAAGVFADLLRLVEVTQG